MEATSKSLERLRNGYQIHLNGTDDVEDSIINELENKFHLAINDDLNMPVAMGVVWDTIRQEKKSPKFAKLLKKSPQIIADEIQEKTKTGQNQTN